MSKIYLSFFSLVPLFAQSATGLKLGGTLMNGKDGTRAIIELGDGRTTQVCEAGKACSKNACDCEVASYKVIRIEARKATLQRGNERFTLTLDGLRPEGQSGKYARTLTRDFSQAKLRETLPMRGDKASAVLHKLLDGADVKPTDTIKTVQGFPIEKVKWGTVHGSIQDKEQVAIEIESEGKLILLQLKMVP
ncbi:MAG: hypothetical protein J0L53_16780 [Spirochaetes bacterium]|nr:hypothetical protein [Spirochaetota bacterium]